MLVRVGQQKWAMAEVRELRGELLRISYYTSTNTAFGPVYTPSTDSEWVLASATSKTLPKYHTVENAK